MTYIILLNDGTWFEKTNRVGVPGEMRVIPLTKALVIGTPLFSGVYAPRVGLVSCDRRNSVAIYREMPG